MPLRQKYVNILSRILPLGPLGFHCCSAQQDPALPVSLPRNHNAWRRPITIGFRNDWPLSARPSPP
jgi:hypothetical protein